jgi:hypothetical protein
MQMSTAVWASPRDAEKRRVALRCCVRGLSKRGVRRHGDRRLRLRVEDGIEHVRRSFVELVGDSLRQASIARIAAARFSRQGMQRVVRARKDWEHLPLFSRVLKEVDLRMVIHLDAKLVRVTGFIDLRTASSSTKRSGKCSSDAPCPAGLP